MISLFALNNFNNGIESGFRFTVTVEKQWIVGPPAYGHIAAPGLAVMDPPKRHPADLVAVLMKERK